MQDNPGKLSITKKPDAAWSCSHAGKIYASHILTSNPPQHPWICPDCLQEGVDDHFHKNPPETYEQVKARKMESIKNG